MVCLKKLSKSKFNTCASGNLETTENFSLELPRYSHCSIRVKHLFSMQTFPSYLYHQVGQDTMILTGGIGDEFNLLDDVTEFFNIGAPPQQVTVK